MKVLVIGEFPPPAGGMAVQAEALCRSLTREGMTVGALRRNARLPGWLSAIPFLRGGANTALFLLRLLFSLPGADVVYVFTNSYLSFYLFTLPPVMMGRLFGKRILVSYHGGAARGFLQKKHHGIARALLRAAPGIVVPSGYLKEVLSGFGLSATVTPNILDMERLVFRERRPVRPLFLVSRHLEPVYNVSMVLRSFAPIRHEHPDARLVICGAGSERDLLERLSIDLGIPDSVRFLGAVPNREMADVYAQADILLNGSSTDNQPMAILEAFACGLPVVSTSAGGIPWLIKDRENGLLVKPGDHAAMSEAIRFLLNNPDRACAMAQKGKESLSTFSWSSISKTLMPLLTGPFSEK